MKKFTLIFTALIISVCTHAQSFIVAYTFDSVKTTSGMTDPTAVPLGPNITCGSFAATTTGANSAAAFRFDFPNWPLGSIGGAGDTLFSGMTGSISTSEYYEVTITPQTGYLMNLDSIKFGFERSATGVRTYAVRSSMDAFTANLTAVYVAPNNNVEVDPGNIFFLRKDIVTPQTRSLIILGGTSFTNIATPVTFRFYAWNAEATSGTFSIDNVRFIGSSAVATGITEKINEGTAVYPNPSVNGLFTLDLNPASAKTTIIVYNIIGKVILSKQLDATTKQTLDLSGQPNGSYFVSIKNDKETITKKIIINK